MKNIITILMLTLTLTSCAQNRTITFALDTNNLETVNSVSIIGDVKPLTQKEGYVITNTNGDGIYRVKINFKTSKRNVNFKFSVNGDIELKGSDSRRIWFKDEPITKAYVFNEFDYYNKEQISKLKYTDEQIEEDISILKNVIQYVHPNIYKFRDSIALQNDFKALKKDIKSNPTLNNAYGSISKFAAKIKCSHTFTNPWNQGVYMERLNFYQPNKIPFTFNRIGKRLLIDKNASENPLLKKGLEIVAINAVKTDEVLTRLSDYVTSDGNIYEKKLERLSVTGEEKFSMFDIFYPIEFGSVTEFKLTLKDLNTNEEFEATVKATSKTNRTKILIDRYGNLETSLKDGWNFEIINESTARLSIKSFAVQRNEFDWEDYLDNVFEQLDKKSIPNFIIDIRGNEGGQTIVGQYILERVLQKPFNVNAMESSVRYMQIPSEFEKYISTWDRFPYNYKGKISSEKNGRYFLKQKYSIPETILKPKKNGYKGKVYLMTDASNSSATHIMATYAKQMENITIVGQETGGNQMGMNADYIFFFRLPNTKVELDIPAISQYIPTGRTPLDGGIKPHIEIKKNVQDFINNIDTELNAVLNLIKTK